MTGAATITVTGITGDQILLHIAGASSANASSEMTLRFNTDSTSKYSRVGFRYSGGANYSPDNSTNFSNGINVSDSIIFGRMDSSHQSTVSGYLLVTGASTANNKAYNGVGAGSNFVGTSQVGSIVGGVYTGSSAITSVSIISSTGDFDAGTIHIFKA